MHPDDIMPFIRGYITALSSKPLTGIIPSDLWLLFIQQPSHMSKHSNVPRFMETLKVKWVVALLEEILVVFDYKKGRFEIMVV